MQPADFLAHIFEETLDEGYFSIFLVPSRRTRFFNNVEEAGAYAASHDSSSDVFFSVGIFKEGVQRRGTEADVIGLATLQADIDVKADIDSRENLPPTKEDALEFLNKAIPYPPTIITDSGHGLHAFWVFKEPWIFETMDEKHRAKQLAKNLNRTVAREAARNGWTVDSTYDLARVMRVCGTTNIKDPDNPAPTKALQISGEYYIEQDFDDVLLHFPDAELTECRRQNLDAGESSNPLGLKLEENAVPPEEKFEDMMNHDPDFKALFLKQKDMEKMRKKGKDGKDGDASLSSYDMSLANTLANNGWTEQEIANLIISFRRKHMTKQADLKKALRPKYMNDLILKATENRIKEDNHEELEKLSDWIVNQRLNPSAQAPSEDEMERKKETARQRIATSLQIKIKHINKYMTDPPSYELVMDDGVGTRINIGGAGQLLNQGNLRLRIFEATNITLKSLKKAAWEQAMNVFGLLIREVETGDETRDLDALSGWIKDYLEEAGVWDDPDDAVLDKRPFCKAKRTYIFFESLKNYIHVNKNEKMVSKDIGKNMTKLGCVNGRQHFNMPDGKRTTKSVYDVTPVLGK